MKTAIIAIVFLLIGGAVGRFLALGFGAGMGAGAGIVVGSQAGACLAMESAKDQGLLSTEQIDQVLAGAIGKIKSKAELPPDALMYPDASVPVVQLSIDLRRDPAHHFRLGTLLHPLRDEGVFIIASGGASHNLRHVFRSAPGEPTTEWVIEFREWLAETIENDQRDDLVHYRTRAPHAAMNHPTEEHFLPLLSAFGATEAGESRQRIHVSETLGALAMDAYIFGT